MFQYRAGKGDESEKSKEENYWVMGFKSKSNVIKEEKLRRKN